MVKEGIPPGKIPHSDCLAMSLAGGGSLRVPRPRRRSPGGSERLIRPC